MNDVELVERIQNFNDATSLQELTNRHSKFVIFMALKYKNFNVDIEDMISEGNIGLLKAVKSFDVSKNVKFITYAKFYIRKYILLYLNKNYSMLKVPVVKRVEVPIMTTINEELLSNGYSVEDIIEKQDLMVNLINCINGLTSRDKSIMIERYGLNGATKTLSQIAAMFDLTKERVRQILLMIIVRIRLQLH